MPREKKAPSAATSLDLARCRLRAQQLVGSTCRTPAEVVARLGAMQAQDSGQSRWAIASRCGCSEAAIDEAIAQRRIVRTWSLRGTLHWLPADTLHAVLAVTGPATLAKMGSTLRQHELDGERFVPVREAIREALRGGSLTREALCAALEAKGIATAGQRSSRIIYRAALEGLLCLGAPLGKQPGYVLLEDWLPATTVPSLDEALAQFTLRYFDSHGPARLQDFAWWGGLTLARARQGLEMCEDRLVATRVGDYEYWHLPGIEPSPEHLPLLLAGYDEYLLGYADRSAVVAEEHAGRIMTVNGIFNPCIVIDGQVAGLWKREQQARRLLLSLMPFSPLRPRQRTAVEAAAQAYADRMELALTLSWG